MLFDFLSIGLGPRGPPGDPGLDGSDGDPGIEIDGWSINEIPSGSVNGINVTFMLSHFPAGSIMFYHNGQYMTPDKDFTLSDITITLAFAPVVGDKLLVNYPYKSTSSGIVDLASHVICILLQLG